MSNKGTIYFLFILIYILVRPFPLLPKEPIKNRFLSLSFSFLRFLERVSSLERTQYSISNGFMELFNFIFCSYFSSIVRHSEFVISEVHDQLS